MPPGATRTATAIWTSSCRTTRPTVSSAMTAGPSSRSGPKRGWRSRATPVVAPGVTTTVMATWIWRSSETAPRTGYTATTVATPSWTWPTRSVWTSPVTPPGSPGWTTTMTVTLTCMYPDLAPPTFCSATTAWADSTRWPSPPGWRTRAVEPAWPGRIWTGTGTWMRAWDVSIPRPTSSGRTWPRSTATPGCISTSREPCPTDRPSEPGCAWRRTARARCAWSRGEAATGARTTSPWSSGSGTPPRWTWWRSPGPRGACRCSTRCRR